MIRPHIFFLGGVGGVWGEGSLALFSSERVLPCPGFVVVMGVRTLYAASQVSADFDWSATCDTDRVYTALPPRPAVRCVAVFILWRPPPPPPMF